VRVPHPANPSWRTTRVLQDQYFRLTAVLCPFSPQQSSACNTELATILQAAEINRAIASLPNLSTAVPYIHHPNMLARAWRKVRYKSTGPSRCRLLELHAKIRLAIWELCVPCHGFVGVGLRSETVDGGLMMRVLEERLFAYALEGVERTHEDVEKSIHRSLEHGDLGALGQYVKAGAVPLGVLRTCRVMYVALVNYYSNMQVPEQCILSKHAGVRGPRCNYPSHPAVHD
jgi:hypothetical protein